MIQLFYYFQTSFYRCRRKKGGILATIQEKIKDGKIVSFKFKACLGRSADGKQVFKCLTWYPEEGLTKAKSRWAAAAADASTTLNYYVASDLEQARAATDKFAAAFGI